MRENSTVKIVSEEFSLLAYLDSIFLYALYQHNVAKITEIAVLFEDPWNAGISPKLYRKLYRKIFWIPKGHNYGIAENRELHMMI